MAFESLSDKIQATFKKLTGKGMLTEADVKAAMRDVKLALLEADVNYKVVKDFVKAVEARAVGSEVMSSLTPGQAVIKIVNEEMIRMMGSEGTEIKLLPRNEITVYMMEGLQGAGKTTTAAKLAALLQKKKDRKPLLVACDIYRPAAIDQLKVNGEKLGIPVFSPGSDIKPPVIAQMAMEEAKQKGYNLVLLDTAGRLHVDQAMMDELKEIKATVPVTQSVLVLDAMTGQDAVNVAQSFDEQIGVDGVILTKLDSDTRGGAALSVKAVTGKPIFYAGMGEKLTDLEQFYPQRMANRILGMGDILSLIEKAEALELDDAKTEATLRKLRKSEFDLEDFLEQMQQIKKMGPLSDLLGAIPGLGSKLRGAQMPDDGALKKVEAIIYSMTPKERHKPEIINGSRRRRIANGAGTTVMEVNRLLKQFDQSKQMMKQMTGKMGKKGKMPFNLPF
ncbi:MAG: signal recognition particle protein [Lachnospiraceae bacterium]|nr:signal recognition particle protein [Lachnospiraceae bacterium]